MITALNLLRLNQITFFKEVGKRWETVREETTLTSERAHSHVSMMTDPIEDAELIRNLSRSPNKTSNSPSKSTISDHAKLEIQ